MARRVVFRQPGCVTTLLSAGECLVARRATSAPIAPRRAVGAVIANSFVPQVVRKLRGALLVVAAGLLVGACAAPATRAGESSGGPAQAFVSAALLTHWCRSSDAVDVEACLSYLRGNFDTREAFRAADPGRFEVEGCIPPTVAITALRARVRERVADADADRAVPAARMLAVLWREHYPCVEPVVPDDG